MAIIKNSTLFPESTDGVWLKQYVVFKADNILKQPMLTPIAYRMPGLECASCRPSEVGTYQLISYDDYVRTAVHHLNGETTYDLFINRSQDNTKIRLIKAAGMYDVISTIARQHPWVPQFMASSQTRESYNHSFPDSVAPVWCDVEFSKKKRYLENIIRKYGLPFKSKIFMNAPSDNISSTSKPLPKIGVKEMIFENVVLNREFYVSDGDNSKAKPLVFQPRVINHLGEIIEEGKAFSEQEQFSRRYVVMVTTITTNKVTTGLGITVSDLMSNTSK